MKSFFKSFGEVYNDRSGMTRMMIVPAFFTIIFSFDLTFYFTCLFLSFSFSVAITMSELKKKGLEGDSNDCTENDCDSKQENETSSDKKE